MNIKNHAHFKPLIACLSKDETRSHFGCIKMHNNYAITSDGHKLFATKELFNGENGKFYNGEVFGKVMEWLPVNDITWPDIQFLLNTSAIVNPVTVRIPKWFSSLKKNDRVPITFDYYYGRVLVGGIERESENQVCIDASHLASLAHFDEVRIWLGDNAMAPIVITSVDTKMEDRFKGEWFMIVMPYRGKGGIVTQTGEMEAACESEGVPF